MRISDWSSDVCSSDLAKVLTYTADSLTYTPDPPNYYGMIEFDGGGRMMIEFTDADPASIYVGAPVRMMFRIKAHDERSGRSAEHTSELQSLMRITSAVLCSQKKRTRRSAIRSGWSR